MQHIAHQCMVHGSREHKSQCTGTWLLVTRGKFTESGVSHVPHNATGPALTDLHRTKVIASKRSARGGHRADYLLCTEGTSFAHEQCDEYCTENRLSPRKETEKQNLEKPKLSECACNWSAHHSAHH